MVTKVRRVLATLAVGCFFLPLGQCTHVRFESAQVRADGRLETAEPTTVTDVFVPARVTARGPVTFDGICFDVLLVCAFFWPLLAATVEGRAKTDAVRRLINGAELLASAGTLYALYLALRVFQDIQPAGYVAVATFAALFLLSLLQSTQVVHSWLTRRLREPIARD
jgi:hypothetical protein